MRMIIKNENKSPAVYEIKGIDRINFTSKGIVRVILNDLMTVKEIEINEIVQILNN
jgi:hypothetical protein